MKGDFTRSTFDRRKHYSGVRMQQGRVQVDADWNEQIDLAAYREETEVRDMVGRCGGPLNGAGFAITAAAPNLTISAGRYYVDGILCENEVAVPIATQPSLPANGALVTLSNNTVVPVASAPAGTYVAYLDVWTRHVTAIEDRGIREVALGGPDTATRTQTVWQAKLFQAGAANASINCLTALPGLDALFATPTGLLAARAQPGQISNDPCIVAPGAGFRRLENQLYRVEVHAGGNTNTATFKWSRDNGSVVSAWESKNQDALKVASPGRDKVLGFAGGQWIELTDDTREQLRQPGTLVRLLKAEGQVLTIDPATATGPTDIASFPLNPKVRRWDSAGAATIAVPIPNQGWLALEDGVEVHFTSSAQYRTGDYWLIPARTATGDVEWPRDPATQAPLPQAPHGVQHHLCRLAVVRFEANVWTLLSDCRNLFPAATELLQLFHVEGDGQEACPNPTQPATRILLGRPLIVGVTNGRWPVQGARVRFTVTVGAGTFGNNLATFETTTDANGLASTNWNVDATALNQEVEARLLDANNQPVHLPVRFNASLSVASQVAYDPAACANLSSARTVQQALDILCQITGTAACEILVGPGQNFTRLDLALQQLLVTENRKDIRLCLLPGNHTLPSGLTINATPGGPAQVSIHGGGPGTVVESSGRFVVNSIGTLILRDLTLNFNNIVDPMFFGTCDHLEISSCRLTGVAASGTLLTLGNNVGRAVFQNDVIDARRVVQGIEFLFPSPSIVLQRGFGDVTIESCNISGQICLYGAGPGANGESFLTDTPLAKLKPLLAVNANFGTQNGILSVRGNRLHAMTLAQSVIFRIYDWAAPQNPGTLDLTESFRTVFVNDNKFMRANNSWVGRQVILGGNLWEDTGSPGCSIAIHGNLFGNITTSFNSPLRSAAVDSQSSTEANTVNHCQVTIF